MKLHKLAFIGVFVALIAIVASGCSSDRTRWRATELNFGADAYIRNNAGLFEEPIRISAADILDFQPSREDLLDIRFVNSWVILSNLDRRHRINRFEVVVVNGSRYSYLGEIYPNSSGEFVIEDRDFDDFMDDLVYDLKNKRYIDIIVRGYSNIIDDQPIAIDFNTNIDILVRD